MNRFSYVKFYSLKHAMDCVQRMRNVRLHNRTLIPNFPRKKQNIENESTIRASRDLTIDKSIEMINFFFGYNSWSSQIVEMEGIEYAQTDDGVFSKFKCTVKFTFKNDDRSVEAEGIGDALEEERCDAVDHSRKRAVTEARKNVFKKLAVILLDDNRSFLYIENNPFPKALMFEDSNCHYSQTDIPLPEKNRIQVDESEWEEKHASEGHKLKKLRTYLVSSTY